MKHIKLFENFTNDDLISNTDLPQDNDMMTDEEVKKELLDKIDYMIANVNQWSVRDTLKHFTGYGFWKGDNMAIINPEIAKKIATELYNYVDFLKPGDSAIGEVYDEIYKH
jgi:hypothetical protein